MTIRFGLLGLASLLAAAALPAQAVPLPPRAAVDSGAYTPRHRLPSGRQLVVVFIGQAGCGASRDPELKAAVRRMKPLLARQADSLGRPLSIGGVALEWAVDSGVAYLRGLGAWDEIGTGNNWGSLGAVRYIWREPDGRPTIPQVVLYERTVTPGERAIAFGPERRLARFLGADEIIGWVERGAPLPPLPPRGRPAKRRAPAG